jgi:hypothetical protein
MCCSWMNAQVNLVPNPGFEDTLQCDHTANEFQGFVSNWYGLNVQYFNYWCGGDSGIVSLPRNLWGFQYQRNGGAAYAGLAPIYLDSFASTKNVRDYIYVPLTDTLTGGRPYFVSFYVSLANNVMYACNDLGAKFTKTQPYLDHTLMSGNQIANDPIANPLTDTSSHWMMVKGRFIASGGEKYIIIGNFVSDSLSHVQFVHTWPNLTYDWRESFYYIDDVYVGLDSLSIMGVPSYNASKASVTLYPNPNNGNMQIAYDLGTHQESVLELFDVCGKLERSYVLDPERKELQLSEESLTPGLYFYQVHTAGTLLASGKFAVVR